MSGYMNINRLLYMSVRTRTQKLY